MAISNFTEGFDLYQQHKELVDGDTELKLKVCQILTNRALCWHQLEKHDDVIKDCTTVLKYLDDSNPKALFRRAHSYK